MSTTYILKVVFLVLGMVSSEWFPTVLVPFALVSPTRKHCLSVSCRVSSEESINQGQKFATPINTQLTHRGLSGPSIIRVVPDSARFVCSCVPDEQTLSVYQPLCFFRRIGRSGSKIGKPDKHTTYASRTLGSQYHLSGSRQC